MNSRQCAGSLFTVALLLAGCNLSPLRNRIKVGEEPIVIFVGEGIDGHTDLFAVPASGGSIAQLTFTPLLESMPRINARGDVVAFIRARDTAATAANEVVVMNLLNGAERAVPLPDGAGHIKAIAWGPGDSALYLRSDGGTWRASTPPAPTSVVAATGSDFVQADSVFELWVGEPRFARLFPCQGGGVCAVGPRVDTTVLSEQGRDPLRWGSDSVAWFEGDGMVVRGIGPGTVRRILWKRPPLHPRDGSYGAVTTALP
ncbi:MAG: hypothetical protein V4503_11235 [Gemmatimonadota bacterium]